MSPAFRLARVLVAAPLRSRLGPLDESSVELRVWPVDLDLNGHMNNGRYLSLMDLGRVDLMTRMGVTLEALRQRWVPMVGSAAIRFRRSLRPFEAYRLRSRIACWDAKWFYIEQRFEADGSTAALGWIKGLMRTAAGNVPPADILAAAGHAVRSPPVPRAIRTWLAAEAAMNGLSPRTVPRSRRGRS